MGGAPDGRIAGRIDGPPSTAGVGTPFHSKNLFLLLKEGEVILGIDKGGEGEGGERGRIRGHFEVVTHVSWAIGRERGSRASGLI